jgi:hypothetical protein
MNVIFRFGLGALAIAAFSLTTCLSDADTLDPANAFTKHGLPVPGAYFKNKENTQWSVAAVAKSGKSVTNPNPTASKAAKKQANHVRSATNVRSATS